MKKNLPIYLQVYTVRDAFQEDWKATFRRIAEIGYEGVELYKIPDNAPATEVATFLRDLNLKVSALMAKLEPLEQDLATYVRDVLALGADTLTIPWIQDPQTSQGWLDYAKRMKQVGDELRKEGLHLQYHNHAFEFNVYDGKNAMALLAEGTTAQTLRFEADTCWVKHGGDDPVSFMRRYADRIRHLHCKDKLAGEELTFSELGAGILDWANILPTAQHIGVECLIVEQDDCAGDPFVSIEKSLRYLRG